MLFLQAIKINIIKFQRRRENIKRKTREKEKYSQVRGLREYNLFNKQEEVRKNMVK